jgi:hypothetical protein
MPPARPSGTMWTMTVAGKLGRVFTLLRDQGSGKCTLANGKLPQSYLSSCMVDHP